MTRTSTLRLAAIRAHAGALYDVTFRVFLRHCAKELGASAWQVVGMSEDEVRLVPVMPGEFEDVLGASEVSRAGRLN